MKLVKDIPFRNVEEHIKDNEDYFYICETETLSSIEDYAEAYTTSLYMDETYILIKELNVKIHCGVLYGASHDGNNEDLDVYVVFDSEGKYTTPSGCSLREIVSKLCKDGQDVDDLLCDICYTNFYDDDYKGDFEEEEEEI